MKATTRTAMLFIALSAALAGTASAKDFSLGRDRQARPHRPDAMARFNKADTNHDGVVTYEEFAAAMPDIMAADTKGDGKVTVGDLAAYLEKTRATHAAEAIMRWFGKNKEGAISQADVDSRGKAVFGFLDRNGDGKIEHGELPGRAALARFGPGIGPMAGLFRHDGKDGVTLDELSAAMPKIMDADTNGDGKVTLDELTAWVEKRGAERWARAMMARFGKHPGDELTAPEVDNRERAVFAYLDRNGDGKIEKDELPRHSLMRRVDWHPDRGGRFGSFRELEGDLRRNGSVDFDQFKAAWPDVMAADANGDGKVSLAELAHYTQQEMGMRAARAMMRRFGKGDDGVLTKADVEAREKKLFAYLDRNGDGKIEKSEVPRGLFSVRRPSDGR